jgi:hypothetical protein
MFPEPARTWDADQVTISIAGVPIVSGGFAEGEFLRIEYEEDAFTDKVGTGGSVVRSKTKDERATATIMLLPTAAANAVLQALHARDKAAPNGAGVGRFLVEDLNTGEIWEGPQAWIVRAPDVSFDREPTMREWRIRIANLKPRTVGA